MSLENMGSFFNKRANSYEEHMMTNVKGADVYYKEIAKLIPESKDLELLDLGCGTGLELDEIFKVNSSVLVTGIDLAKDMLEILRKKHADKLSQINLINCSYFDYDYKANSFDIAVSVQTMHHFKYEAKVNLYKKILNSIKDNGYYIECDYIAKSQEVEDFHFAENERIREEQGITEGFYHYDTPCTIENQIKLLYKAGFSEVSVIWEYEDTVILKAIK